jgi:hypothetical protein
LFKLTTQFDARGNFAAGFLFSQGESFVAAKTMTGKRFSDATADKMSRIARMLGASTAAVTTMAERAEETFLSVGRAREHTNGRTIVYADERIPLMFTASKHVVKSRALVKDAIECPIAKCGKDADACWLGAYATSVHVGNATVTFWSELCPHIVVKCMLPMQIREAIRDWDEQVKKKRKNRQFRLADGTYFLSPYPPSLDHTYTRVKKSRKIVVRGKNFTKPTRRLTVKSDISLAMAASPAAKRAQRRAAAKRKSVA